MNEYQRDRKAEYDAYLNQCTNKRPDPVTVALFEKVRVAVNLIPAFSGFAVRKLAGDELIFHDHNICLGPWHVMFWDPAENHACIICPGYETQEEAEFEYEWLRIPVNCIDGKDYAKQRAEFLERKRHGLGS